MKITKFPQSCILVETQNKKILIDPGQVKFQEKFLTFWKQADAVLITHKHSDHCYGEVVESLNVPVFTTKEVNDSQHFSKISIVKENDVFFIGKIRVEVVHAVHGYVLPAGEIKENVGFILDDGKTRLYITSDTIRFKNNQNADVLFANITAFDASMNLWGATATMQEVGAKLLIVAHQDAGKMIYEKETINNYLQENHINFVFPEILETITI